MKKMCIIFAGIMVLSNCSSIREKKYTGTADTIISFINTGKIEQMNDITDTPFILDEEIIILSEDMDSFWRNISNAGFVINDPVFTDTFIVKDDDYKAFADKMEVESFFKNYISEEARIMIIETADFRLIFLLDNTGKGEIRIKGFKGPEAL